MSHDSDAPAPDWIRVPRPHALDLIDKLLTSETEVELLIGDDLEVRLRPAPAEQSQPAPLASSDKPSGLILQANTADVWVEGQRTETLTAMEFDALQFLYSRRGTAAAREDLSRLLWPDRPAADCTAALGKVVSRLRSKIEPEPGRRRYLVTIRGRGYRLNTDPASTRTISAKE